MSVNAVFGDTCKLAGRVAVYVPGTIDANIAADNREAVERVASILSELFGGATAQSASGYWLSAVHGLIAERVTVVYSNADPEDIDKHARDIKDIADWIKKTMKQEAVSVEINSALYIV